MQAFTLIVLAALVLTTLARVWLGVRQVRHVRAHRDAVPAAFAGEVSLADHQKAADYSAAKMPLAFAHIFLDAALLLAYTLGGGLQALDDLWRGVFGSELLVNLALVASALTIATALELPLSVYRTFVIEARFGFNQMKPGIFVSDLFKQMLLATVLGLPLLAGVLWLMQSMGDNWWFYVWLAWMGFNLLVLAIYPTFIAPIFNKFSPLEDATLKARIEQLLARCGFKAQGLFVMDGSRRSRHGNAYFTGFGAAKRIVFFDTLLKTLNCDEIEAVLAHELGHFKRHHVFKRIAWMFAMSLAFLWLLGWLMQEPWFYHGLNATTQSTGMALMLFFMILPVFSFVLQPLGSYYSRRHEFEADSYAAGQSSPRHLVSALVKLYKDNAATLTPDPLHSLFYDSHPGPGQRIAHLQNLAHNS
jgi:STE24 endopeptidase